jgi:hypothetical protein
VVAAAVYFMRVGIVALGGAVSSLALIAAWNYWRLIGRTRNARRDMVILGLVISLSSFYLAVYATIGRWSALIDRMPFHFRDIGTLLQVIVLAALLVFASNAGRKLRKEVDGGHQG